MFKIYSLIIIIYRGFHETDKHVKWITLDACKVYLKIFRKANYFWNKRLVTL